MVSLNAAGVPRYAVSAGVSLPVLRTARSIGTPFSKGPPHPDQRRCRTNPPRVYDVSPLAIRVDVAPRGRQERRYLVIRRRRR